LRKEAVVCFTYVLEGISVPKCYNPSISGGCVINNIVRTRHDLVKGNRSAKLSQENFILFFFYHRP